VFPLRDRNPTQRIPYVTILLIVANVAAYFFVQPQGQQLLGRSATQGEESRFSYEYAAIPCEIVTGEPLSIDELPTAQGDIDNCRTGRQDPIFPDKHVWLALLFSLFLHGSLVHLGGNMLFLWVFGNNIEDHLGALRYLAFYLVGGVVATLAHVAVQPASTVPLIGASGAVAAVMGAYLVWFPNAPVLTAFFFILVLFREITAKWLLGFWLVSQFFINPNAGVAWVAHVGGFVFGVAIGLVVRMSRTARGAAWRQPYLQPDRDPFTSRRLPPY
jgi:membrane associated rhomboid family serine protease